MNPEGGRDAGGMMDRSIDGSTSVPTPVKTTPTSATGSSDDAEGRAMRPPKRVAPFSLPSVAVSVSEPKVDDVGDLAFGGGMRGVFNIVYNKIVYNENKNGAKMKNVKCVLYFSTSLLWYVYSASDIDLFELTPSCLKRREKLVAWRCGVIGKTLES
jgi:hypothetical protein